MTATSPGSGTVFVVEDERPTAEAYELALEPTYDVRVAHSVAEALDRLDGDVDVLLLDRRMPKLVGDAIFDHPDVREHDCRIAMVTAVNPDFDIIDMGFDDYLVKPIGPTELRDTVERLLALDAYDERHRELSAKRVKRNVLELEKTPSKLEDSEAFAALQARIAELEADLDELETSYDIKRERGVQ